MADHSLVVEEQGCNIKTKITNSDRKDAESTRQHLPSWLIPTKPCCSFHLLCKWIWIQQRLWVLPRGAGRSIETNGVKTYVCKTTNGTAKPNIDNHPLFARSSTLMLWKKPMSYYKSNKLMTWNAIAQVGNPMRPIEVNELIKTVKKQEVQKQGKSSTTWQAITHPNISHMLDFLKKKMRMQCVDMDYQACLIFSTMLLLGLMMLASFWFRIWQQLLTLILFSKVDWIGGRIFTKKGTHQIRFCLVQLTSLIVCCLSFGYTLRYSWVQKEDREACHLVFLASVTTSLYQTVVAKQKARYKQFSMPRFSVTKSFRMELGVF
jgi:hypothetical protein